MLPATVLPPPCGRPVWLHRPANACFAQAIGSATGNSHGCLKAKNIDSFLKWSSSLSPSILKKPCGINAISKIDSPVELMDVANIKMTFDSEYRCTYMSRAPIPFPYKSLNCTYYKHIGIIGYTRKMLDFFVSSVPGYFEKIEGIDLLRFVDYGKPLYLHEIKECCSLSVDTEKDLEEVRIRIGKN